MAKAQGIIGNFKGKIGNTVGYQLTSSNNKQTQGIRIYQPNVKNPKTSAQAEQRAKLAPINATYRALKMVIDRGNEGLPYGNKSRLAWLKQAFKAQWMPWFVKGQMVNAPVGCQLTKGSLSNLELFANEDAMVITCTGVTAQTEVDTVGKISTILLGAYPFLKAGDQVTFVAVDMLNQGMNADVDSIVIDTESAVACTNFQADTDKILYQSDIATGAYSVIISREGANGEHLRSTSFLLINNAITEDAPYDEASKTAAVKSYMAATGANTDWSEEPID
jgi:hypothetical protein